MCYFFETRCITAFITERLEKLYGQLYFNLCSLTWSVDNTFVLPDVITLWCLHLVSARMSVRHLLLSTQLPGTHRAMICMIRRLALTVSDVCLKLSLFQNTSRYIGLQLSHCMRYINSHVIYLLTVLN